MKNIKAEIEQDAFFYIKDIEQEFNLSWDEAINLIKTVMKNINNQKCSKCKEHLTSKNWIATDYKEGKRSNYCSHCIEHPEHL